MTLVQCQEETKPIHQASQTITNEKQEKGRGKYRPKVPVSSVDPRYSHHFILCLWQKCPSTSTPFASHEELYIHIIQDHVQEGRQECRWHPLPHQSVCGKPCRHRGQMLEHVIVHMNTSLKPFTCKLCLYKMRNRQEVKKHFDKVHPIQSQNKVNEQGVTFQVGYADRYSAKYVDHLGVTHVTSDSVDSQVVQLDSKVVQLDSKVVQLDSKVTQLDTLLSPLVKGSTQEQLESRIKASLLQKPTSSPKVIKTIPSVIDYMADTIIRDPSCHYTVGMSPLVMTSLCQIVCTQLSLTLPYEWVSLLKTAVKSGTKIPPPLSGAIITWCLGRSDVTVTQQVNVARIVEMVGRYLSAQQMQHILQAYQHCFESSMSRLRQEAMAVQQECIPRVPCSPMRTLLMDFIDTFKNMLLKLSNEDVVNIGQVRDPDSVFYVDPLDCTRAQLGMRISLRFKTRGCLFDFVGNGYARYMWRRNELFDLVAQQVLYMEFNQGGELVEKNAWHSIPVLCCQGLKCCQLHSSWHQSHCKYKQVRGSMQLVQLQNEPTFVVWMRLGFDLDWVLSSPPDPATSSSCMSILY